MLTCWQEGFKTTHPYMLREERVNECGEGSVAPNSQGPRAPKGCGLLPHGTGKEVWEKSRRSTGRCTERLVVFLKVVIKPQALRKQFSFLHMVPGARQTTEQGTLKILYFTFSEG